MNIFSHFVLLLQSLMHFGSDPKTQLCIKHEPYEKTETRILENSYATYYEFLQSTAVYIDKSLLILALLTEHTSSTILITAPPKWGKTLNLKMIRFFFEWEIDEENLVRFYEYTNANKFFFSGRFYIKEAYGIIGEFDKPPLISKYTKLIDAHAARWPVLYLEMNRIRLRVSNFAEFFVQFKETIRDVYEQHLYVARWLRGVINYKVTHNQTDFIIRTMQNDLNKFELFYTAKARDENTYKNSLVFLGYLLHKYYLKKTIILIDEYDSVFKNLYLYGGHRGRINTQHRTHIQTFLLDFYDITLRGNRYLHRSVITGILPIPITISSSGFSDITFMNYADPKLYPYYGFSEQDFRDLCHYRNVPENVFKEAYEYYRGYHVQTDNKLKLFNPWSIVKFINTLKPDNYWTLSEASTITPKLKHHDEIRNVVTDLVFDQCVSYLSWQSQITPHSMFEQLTTLEKLTSEDPRDYQPYDAQQNLYTKRIDIILWYLHANGFLTLTHFENNTYCMKSPNSENKALLASLMSGIHIKQIVDQQKLADSLIALMPIEEEKPNDVDEYTEEFYLSVLRTVYGNRKDQYEEGVLLDEMVFHFALLNVANLAAKRHNYNMEVKMIGLLDSTPHLYNVTNCTNFIRYPNIVLYKDLYGVLIAIRRFDDQEMVNATDLQLREYSEEFLDRNYETKFVRIVLINYNHGGTIDYRCQIAFIGGPKNHSRVSPKPFQFF